MEANNITLFAAVGAFLAAVYHFIIFPTFYSPLSKIPVAHWSVRYCPLWILWIRWKNIENRTVYALHMEKGQIVRLGPSELSLNCFEGGLKQIYLGGFPKTDFYLKGFVNYETENIFTFQNNDQHSSRKRQISNTFSKSFILASESARASVRNVLLGRLLPLLHKAALSKEPVDALSLSYSYSMDSFVHWQFGRRLASNLIENKEERKMYLDGFFGPAKYTFWTYEFPNIPKYLKKIGIQLIPEHIAPGWKNLEDWNLEKCDRAQELVTGGQELSEEDQPVVFAQAYNRMTKGEDQISTSSKNTYPQRLEIASDMFAHNSAAHETSGNTLTYAMYQLSLRPELQRRLRQELLTLSSPLIYNPEPQSQDLPASKDIDALPLLHAVIMETLRLHPSVPGRQPRKTSKTCSLGGFDNIPPNVVVQCYATVLHRTPSVFSDPETWNPQRWITASPSELAEMRRWFWAFGSGGRMCIGANFAYFSMKNALGGIYSNFETTIYKAGDMTLQDGYLAGPSGHNLQLIFRSL